MRGALHEVKKCRLYPPPRRLQAPLRRRQGGPTVETAEKETKRSRKARHAGNDDELPDDSRIPGTSANEEEKLEMLYETIAWPLGRKFGHPYDAFKLALTCVKWAVCAVMIMLTDMASQGAGLGVQPAGDADPTLDDTDPHEHHCEAIDAPAHQNPC